ncbi:MAG: hypothetical protein H6683_03090 [Deltaproteobacteria bacterium]|nr:hypothetical protein [Deltaproteobacteria bacterium]MCB9478640.1 hypothetical protein [Deltaproteobacteria bacterium]
MPVEIHPGPLPDRRVCPQCKQSAFFIFDPVDEKRIYKFSVALSGKVLFESPADERDCPSVTPGTEIHCATCPWFGVMADLFQPAPRVP